MSEQDTKTYRGKYINVSFTASRCSHGGDCLKNLPEVFNLKARPWINMQGADSGAIIEAVHRCPSGALQFSETDDDHVSLQVVRHGPLYMRGNLHLKANFNDAGTQESRLSLCRCGLSKNKPYCDASHRKAFKDAGHFDTRPAAATQQAAASAVDVICVENGPLMCRGNVDMYAADGEKLTVIDPALCRCGASSRKPFCDGSHNKIDFKTANKPE